MFMQIDIVGNKTIKTLILEDLIKSDSDIRNLENELHGHEPFSDIIIVFSKPGCQGSEFRQWLAELKKKNTDLHKKLVIREEKEAKNNFTQKQESL